MKIAYIITRSDEIGGAHIHVRDLAIWMKGKGHETHVFVGGSGVYCDLLQSHGVSFTSLKNLKRPISPLNDLKAVFELASLLDAYKPDLVSIHSAKAGLIGRLACKKLNLNCIFTAHGWSFADGVRFPMRGIYRALERMLSRLNKKIITVCETDRQLAINKSVCSSEVIKTVHNGMPDINQTLLANPVNSITNLVMIARFESQKDHHSLISALATLKHLSWKLDLIGEGDLQQNILTLVEKEGLSDRVSFLGRRWDIAEILSKSDIFILTTFWEGFPRSIIEAMRAGLPVIATNVAGIPESVSEGETGYLVEPADIPAIAERLSELISNPDLRVTMGQNARDKYVNNFTFESMANKTLSIYVEVNE